MSDTAMRKNEEFSRIFKKVLDLRSEPVAVKLVRDDEDFPLGYPLPDRQLSHCQSVMQARHGSKFMIPLNMQMCNTGASFLGMMPLPVKVASGEFHFKMGLFDNIEAAKKTIGEGTTVPFKTKGSVVCPLKDANFEPDVVIFVDIPERIYWFAPLCKAKDGGRVHYTSSPFQAACVDVVSIPMSTGTPNISVGCLGSRKRTDLKPDELIIGVPGHLIPGMVRTLERYEKEVMPAANRNG